MAAASQLEQIAQLVEQLKPLLGKTRGMPIDPDEWNTLVDAMINALDAYGARRAKVPKAAKRLEACFTPSAATTPAATIVIAALPTVPGFRRRSLALAAQPSAPPPYPVACFPRLVCRQGPPDFESGLAT